MNLCHVCERPREPEDDYLVAMRNHLYVDACWACWMKWPDAHKVWPAEGYGRPLKAATNLDPDRTVSLDEVIDLLGAPA